MKLTFSQFCIASEVPDIDAASRRGEVVLFKPDMVASHAEILGILRQAAPSGQHMVV